MSFLKRENEKEKSNILCFSDMDMLTLMSNPNLVVESQNQPVNCDMFYLEISSYGVLLAYTEFWLSFKLSF